MVAREPAQEPGRAVRGVGTHPRSDFPTTGDRPASPEHVTLGRDGDPVASRGVLPVLPGRYRKAVDPGAGVLAHEAWVRPETLRVRGRWAGIPSSAPKRGSSGGGEPTMSVNVSKCFRCGSTDTAARGVEELVRRGPYVVALRLVADVCSNCGERYLQRQDVSTIEDVRRRLELGQLEGFPCRGRAPRTGARRTVAAYKTIAPNAQQTSALAVAIVKSSVPRGEKSSKKVFETETATARPIHDGRQAVREDEAEADGERGQEAGPGARDRLLVHLADAPDLELLLAEERAHDLGGAVARRCRTATRTRRATP